MRTLSALFVVLALGVSACSTTAQPAWRGGKLSQHQQQSAERADQAHRVRAWRSAERFAMGGD